MPRVGPRILLWAGMIPKDVRAKVEEWGEIAEGRAHVVPMVVWNDRHVPVQGCYDLVSSYIVANVETMDVLMLVIYVERLNGARHFEDEAEEEQASKPL